MTPDAGAQAVTTQAASGAGARYNVERRAHQRLTRRPELDGLRGVAVLAVVAFHYGLPGGQQGYVGVDVFFVLSGFLITSILAEEWQRSGSIGLGSFYQRRGRRLFPAFWLMLAVVALTVPLRESVASFTYTMNWAMALETMPLARSLGHTWTLAVEWQYYLIWPVVLIFALARWNPRTIALACLTVGLASAAWRAVGWTQGADWLRVSMGTDTHADGLLIGSAIGLATVYGFAPTPPRLATLAAIAVGLALVLLPALSNATYATGGALVVVLATAVVILRPLPALAFRPLAAVGLVSYGVYLWHVPIWIGLADNGLASPALAILLTFVAAGISYRYVERPILRGRIGSSHQQRAAYEELTRPVVSDGRAAAEL